VVVLVAVAVTVTVPIVVVPLPVVAVSVLVVLAVLLVLWPVVAVLVVQSTWAGSQLVGCRLGSLPLQAKVRHPLSNPQNNRNRIG